MDQYLIYLRKSRQDRELELATGSHDTLQRHRTKLLALAKEQQLHIVEILEEVVSGDTIAARPAMQRLLSLVETGEYAGVLCMEVARLARGNTQDQGIVSETFRWSKTKIITPGKIYDPSDDADDDFFAFSLFAARWEYKTINKRLNQGRMASLEEGKFIAGTAPYGYEKYKLKGQKGYSLRPHPQTAEVVRRIFDLYTSGEPDENGVLQPLGSYKISKRLNSENIPSPGGTLWTASSVRDVLKNPTYKGDVRWHFRPVTKRMEGGVLRISTPTNANATVRKGIHEPLVSEEVWDKAYALRTGNAHSCIPEKRTPQNPLVGLIYCARCGHAMTRMLAAGHNRHDRYACLNAECKTISHRADATERAVLEAMAAWLEDYRLSETEQQDDRIDVVKKAGQELRKKEAALQQLETQQGRLYDLLEQGVYTTEVFLQRSQELAARKEQLQEDLRQSRAAVEKAKAAMTMWRTVIPTMEHVLQAYDFDASAQERNQLLKQAIEKIIYEKDDSGRQPTLYFYPKITK